MKMRMCLIAGIIILLIVIIVPAGEFSFILRGIGHLLTLPLVVATKH